MPIGLSPLRKGVSVVLANNNLKFTGPGVALADTPITPGTKVYWEITLLSTFPNMYVGIASSGVGPLSANYLQINYIASGQHRTIATYATYRSSNKVLDNWVQVFYAGDVIGIAVDTVAGTMDYFRNGTRLGTAFTDINEMPDMYPAISNDNNINPALFNFGAMPFRYGLPEGYAAFDAITYNERIKSSVGSMNVGDFIPCTYTAASNSLGTLSKLGQKPDYMIPPLSSAVASGGFYFIMVGYDREGRRKLVADRVIQHSISWDTLNTAGVASGSGLPIQIDGKDVYTIKLLSGGTTSADKDNEWDKIISESTLNGRIVAGDNAVWNWFNIYTVCSTRSTGTYTVYRGYYDKSTMVNSTGTEYRNENSGFRPVLLTNSSETLITECSLSTDRIHKGSFVVTGRVSNSENEKVRYRIKINGNVTGTWSGYTDSPCVVNTVIPYTALVQRALNAIVIEAESTSSSISSSQLMYILHEDALPSVTILDANTKFIRATLGDTDLDMVRYRITLNDTEVLPWSTFTKSPVDINFPFPRELILIEQENNVKIEVQDELNFTTTVETQFIGVYTGLVFTNPDTGAYYTDDKGNVINYLPIGSVTAGQTTPAYQVRLKNLCGYDVRDLEIWVLQGIPGANLKLCLSEDFAAPLDKIVFSSTLLNGQHIDFWVQVSTTLDNEYQGIFTLATKAKLI